MFSNQINFPETVISRNYRHCNYSALLNSRRTDGKAFLSEIFLRVEKLCSTIVNQRKFCSNLLGCLEINRWNSGRTLLNDQADLNWSPSLNLFPWEISLDKIMSINFMVPLLFFLYSKKNVYFIISTWKSRNVFETVVENTILSMENVSSFIYNKLKSLLNCSVFRGKMWHIICAFRWKIMWTEKFTWLTFCRTLIFIKWFNNLNALFHRYKCHT